MAKKPDAYELNFHGAGSDVIKCDKCGFKCCYYQWLDGRECPKCHDKKGVEGGHIKK